MFDYVSSSFDLGKYCTNVRCETFDLGRGMFIYWIDPAGQLFRLDTDGTQDWWEQPNGKWIFKPNGNRGRVAVCSWTGSVSLFPPGVYDEDHKVMAQVCFVNGVIEQSFPYLG